MTERERQHRDIVGMLLALAYTEKMTNNAIDRIEATGIPKKLAIMMGMWPDAQGELLWNVTVQHGRKLLDAVDKMQPKVKQQIEDDGLELDKGPTGQDAMYAMKTIAERIMAIMLPDSEQVEQFLSSLDQGGQDV